MGISLIDIKRFLKTKIKEMNNTLQPVSNPTSLKTIYHFAFYFTQKYSKLYHNNNITLDRMWYDMQHIKGGYLKFNVLWKAHKKYDAVRPVASGVHSHLRVPSKIVADATKTIIIHLENMFNIKNVITDSFEFIDIISNYNTNQFNSNHKILTADFVSYYTNIPKSLILQQINWCINYFKIKYNSNPAKFHFLIQLCNLIKEGYNKIYKYALIKINETWYSQRNGVIMGLSDAPNISNLVSLVEMVKKLIHLDKNIILLVRQIDDIFMICNSSNIKTCIKKLIYYHPNIKLTIKLPENNMIQFLDIMVIKTAFKLEYFNVHKSLKTEFYIPYKDNHPKHMKLNVIKTMHHRSIYLCSNKQLYKLSIMALIIRLMRSQYPFLFIKYGLSLDSYNNRNIIINSMKNSRIDKLNETLNKYELNYKQIFYPNNLKNIIEIPYNKNYNYKRLIKLYRLHSNKRIVWNINTSLYGLIRIKNSSYNI